MTRSATHTESALWQFGERSKVPCLFVLVLALLALMYLVLVGPGASYTSVWLNDAMALTAGAYRVYSGQTPSVDFKSLFGAAIYYPAALGFSLGYGPGSVLAFGHVVVAAFLLPLVAIVGQSRFSLLPTAVLILFLLLLIAIPMNMGGLSTGVSFGVFYNRHSWACLTIVALCYVQPRSPSRAGIWMDGGALALILLVLLYSTINFAAVAFVLVLANAVVSAYNRRVAMIGLFGVLLGALAVEGLLGYHAAYLADIVPSVQRNPNAVPGLSKLVGTSLIDSQVELVTAFVGLLILRACGRRKLLDAAFIVGLAAACVALANQTGADTSGLPVLAAVLVCFGELLRRQQAADKTARLPSQGNALLPALSMLGLLLIFVAHPISSNVMAAYYYFKATTANPPTRIANLPVRLSGFLVGPETPDPVDAALGHSDAAHADVAKVRRTLGSRLPTAEYLATLAEGTRLLSSAADHNASVVVFDMTDPFTFALELRPTRYGYPFFWADRIVSANHYPPAERFFSDAEYVMVPVLPYQQTQLDTMLSIYGEYLRTHYTLDAKSRHWRLWKRSATVMRLGRQATAAT